MVVLVTREKQERKEGPEITDDKDHRASRTNHSNRIAHTRTQRSPRRTW